MVMVFGVLSGVLAIVLMKIGLSLGWVYLVRLGGIKGLVGPTAGTVSVFFLLTSVWLSETPCCNQAMSVR